MAQTNQSLPSKEASLFRHLVQNYESKQYKKGLKAAEQILRKHPNHGDTQAMKALILSNQGKPDEAFELCKVALKNAMKSHVCWHVYGLLYRAQKNYEEAIKAYRFALRLDPESVQIQRDLALLQIQMRDFPGYIQSRRQMLQARPQLRQNWTALAIGLHLGGDFAGAEDVLQKYEETLKQVPPKSDLEHAEAVLYKNTIIAESGDVARALDHLTSITKSAVDKTSVLEFRAEYLLRLGRLADAEKAYRALLNRNAEKRIYYEALEKTLGLNRWESKDHPRLTLMYQELAAKNTRIDAPRRIPLDFLHDDAFRDCADQYLRRMFTRGVPSTFANVKQLYIDDSKRETIQGLVEGYTKEKPTGNGEAPQIENGSIATAAKASKSVNGANMAAQWDLSVNYFLAQHYDYYRSRDLSKAQQYIEKAIALNTSPRDYTYHMTQARVFKHRGDTARAAETMDQARRMDLKDRYINTKCAKYQLRNDDNEMAIDTMGLFTRKEAVGGPLGDLLDMQCVWFLTEDGESFLRQGRINLALKRFKAVHDIFETWFDDQFDFHTFSLRKGMIRAYVDMMRWQDHLRAHPFFVRAALSAIKIYLMLFDQPEQTRDKILNGDDKDSAAEKKKAAKKAKRELEKAEAERKAAAAKNSQAKADDSGEAKKEDLDPQGFDLIKTEHPLEEALKYLRPLLDLNAHDFNGQLAGFEIHLRREKFLPALKCLVAANKLEPSSSKLKELKARFQQAMAGSKDGIPNAVMAVIDSGLHEIV